MSSRVDDKPWLLVISHVWPVPGASGQELRVAYMLKSLRKKYRVSFLTYGNKRMCEKHARELEDHCEELLLLPSRYSRNKLLRYVLKGVGELYSLFTGLKFSNFIIGCVELTKSRVRAKTAHRKYTAVVLEYWHAHGVVSVFRSMGCPTILDMHNILWQTFKTRHTETGGRSLRALTHYKKREEAAWLNFDYLIAINKEEASYTKSLVGKEKVWYIPMGIDLIKWPFVLEPISPLKVAYYGGLGTEHNQKDALTVYEKIMPSVWEKLPEVELWIIGSNPPEIIRNIAHKDKRVTVTGFVEYIAPVLGQIDLVLCPWKGTYGFRSRLIEIMATGTPVITTHDAAVGMALNDGEGILFNDCLEEWGAMTVDLFNSFDKGKQMRRLARKQIETKYSLEATYDRLPEMIHSTIRKA